jgi:hypothetical protein
MINCVFAVCDFESYTSKPSAILSRSNVRVVVNDASVDDGSLAIEIALSGASLKTPDTLLIEKKKNICFFLSTKEMLTLNSATKDIQTVALYKENEPGFLDIYPCIGPPWCGQWKKLRLLTEEIKE